MLTSLQAEPMMKWLEEELAKHELGCLMIHGKRLETRQYLCSLYGIFWDGRRKCAGKYADPG